MRVGRADLARLLGAGGAAEDAAFLGYEPSPVAPVRELEVAPPAATGGGGLAEAAPVSPPQVPVPLWRVEEVEHREPIATEPERLRRRLTATDRHDPSRSLLFLPPTPPLTPWSRLWPRLRRALAGSRRTQRLDVDAVVRSIGRGEVLARIPWRRRVAWPDEVQVWLDRSDRLVPLAADQEAVEAALAHATSRGAVSRVVVSSVRSLPWRPTSRGAAVLVLGDLGGCGGPEERAAWRQLARRVAAHEGRCVGLTALGRTGDGLSRALAAVVPWSDAGVLCEAELRDARARRLLALVSLASLVQPGLLRAVRQLLPAAEADVVTEIDAWTHAVVRASDASGLVLDTEELPELRAAFAEEDPELQARVSACIRDWHARTPAELRHAETLTWRAHLPAVQAPGEVGEAADFLEKLVGSMQSGQDAMLRGYARRATAALPPSAWSDPEVGPSLQAMWVLAQDGDAEVPAGVDVDAVRQRLGEADSARSFVLRQVGGELRVLPAPDSAEPPWAPGSPVGTLLARDVVVVAHEGRRHRGETQGLVVPLGGEQIVFDGGAQRVVVRPWAGEPWTAAWGRDRFGLWADAVVQDVRQRFRWIAPGRFWMGSPEDEAGRESDEGPRHEVTLTRGYWLANTPVTQALWRAVMGENPSRFRTPERPVERVSWRESVAFCQALAERLPGLDPHLPSEAQWEHACRGGTDTATWRGDLEIRGRRDAPLLDGIAWYGGNSGCDFDLGEGHAAGLWSEKQHDFDIAGTRKVGARDPNPWGLYDMLGNVYEWCADSWDFGPYEPGSRTDPLGTAGTSRVFRGGSWRSSARFVRAAYRRGDPPGLRLDFVGLRVAGGAALRGGAQGPEARDGPGETRDGSRGPGEPSSARRRR